ncbi:MAG: CDP-diacylglycerol--glycerol-3-phosphate 3-phosphatidyltransferase [Elusimicrobiales bacterium]|nr:CDP-diacylglycerol--glycerol-3-phosphate 3-phosphatidyltransferase [Elusimicrobiales bacterium]
MTLANRITITRLSLSLVVFLLIITGRFWAEVAALIVLIVASVSDAVDGAIARSTNTTTSFGAIADPFADKVLVMSVLLAFASIKELQVPLWAVFLILLRELTISTLRVLAALHGMVMKAEASGKIKTTLQMIASFTIMTLTVILFWDKEYILPRFLSFILPYIPSIVWWLVVIAAVFTIFSGILYLRNHMDIIRISWNPRKEKQSTELPVQGKNKK